MRLPLPESRNARILAFVSLANAAGRGAFVSCSTLYFTRVVGLSLAELGTGLTAAAVCGLFSGVPFGYLADRKGPRETAAVLLGLAAAVSTVYLMVDSFVPFLLSACFISLFQGGGSAARQAALAQVVHGPEAVQTRAYLRSLGNVGMAVGTGVAGIALAVDTAPAYLSVMGFNALCLALCPLIILRLPPTPSRTTREGATAAPPKLEVLRDHPYALVALINVMMMIHFQITAIVLPLWVERYTAAPLWTVTVLVLFNTIAVVLFQVRVSRPVTSVTTAVRQWRWSGALLFVACLSFAGSSRGAAATAVIALILAAAVHVYAEMVQSAASSLLSYDLAPQDKHGQYQGFFNTGMSLSQMIAPGILIPLVMTQRELGWIVLGLIFVFTGLAMKPAVRWAVHRQNRRSEMHGNAETPRHLLVINGSRNLPELARDAEPGLRISVITRLGKLGQVWNKENLERVVVLPPTATEQDWVVMAEAIHRIDGIDAIVNFTEYDQIPSAAIGETLNLAIYSRDTALAVNNKYEMRTRLDEAGVDDTACERVGSVSELLNAVDRIGYPAICKPSMGVASQGVSLLRSPDDAATALANSERGASLLDSEELIVERFHEGKEYSVECVSARGDHLVVNITEKCLDEATFRELGHVVPAQVPQRTAELISDTVISALNALGVKDQATHTEVIVTEESVRIVETHLRCGGGRIIEMVREVHGVDMPDAAVRRSLGYPAFQHAEDLVLPQRDETQKRWAASRYVALEPRGTIASVAGESDAAEIPGVRGVTVMKGPGTDLRGLTGNQLNVAVVWAVGTSRNEALESAVMGAEALVFTFQDDE